MHSRCYAIGEQTTVLCSPFLGNRSVNTFPRQRIQRIGKHITLCVLLEAVFSVRSAQSGYKEEFSWEELVVCRDASLPDYELG
jgi:hypothetical protein